MIPNSNIYYSDTLTHCHSASCKQLVDALQQKAGSYKELMDAHCKELDRAMELLRRAETEMRYAGWGKPIADNIGRNDVYDDIVEFLK